MKTKVTSKAQVSIPAAIRKEFNIKPHSQLEWIVENGLITVIPIVQLQFAGELDLKVLP